MSVRDPATRIVSSEPLSDVCALPDWPIARSAIALVKQCETAPIANHSFRTYLFARLIAECAGMEAGADFDEQLLFATCVLHDLGLAPEGDHVQRFEVVGADRAAEFLTAHGVCADDVDKVWEAIALHTTPQIAERRGPLALLLFEGICVDFGGVLGPGRHPEAVTDEHGRLIHDLYPRLSFVSSIVEAMATQASRHPANGPRYTVGGGVMRERGDSASPRTTRMERAAERSRWGS